MRSTQTPAPLMAAALSLALGPVSLADVRLFTDKDEWLAAVGGFATIDFIGHENGQIINSQYSHLGASFTDGNDRFHFNPGFLNDSWGVNGNGDVGIDFDMPQYWIACDFPGNLKFRLLQDGEIFYESPLFGLGGVGLFAGLVSTEPFDGVELADSPKSHVAFIDDIFVGPALCAGDFDNDGEVGPFDLSGLLKAWGTDGPADFDNDGLVGIADLLELLAAWGPCG